MGNFFSREDSPYYISEEQEEDVIDDEDFIPASKEQLQDKAERMDPHITTDAAINEFCNLENAKENVDRVSDNILNVEKVNEIEKELDLYEKISLIYLLYDDAEVALQYMLQLQNDVQLQILTEWALTSKDKWNVKLLEALCIIQNYYILCNMLGYDKKELEVRFLPENEGSSLFIDCIKKKLYRIADSFDNLTTKKFLKIVRDDFQNKRLDFKDYGVQYLEMYFLYWITIKYIFPPHNLKNVCHAFKVMERYDITESLEDLVAKHVVERPRCTNFNFDYNLEKIPRRSTSESPNLQIDLIGQSSLSSGFSDSSLSSARIRKISHEEDDCYNIDPNCPGVCLIVNQENFYTEFSDEWKHLLPKTDKKLENRIGTNIDRDKLKETFEKFGFVVITKDNLDHNYIIPAVKEVISQVPNNSSFIVCILSHGLEGKIYGVNSIPIDVKEIQGVMCKHNSRLKGQPKVLILQSCQGQECQEVTSDDSQEGHDDDQDLQTDGPSVTMVPQTADMLVFWATVPGFGAIRDKKRGSWFIQSLCDKIKEKADKMHLQEICTMVKQEVIRKRWETRKSVRVMVPIEESTFSRFFFLPPIKRAGH
ncbi:hypothetical protein ILUMI_24507 [Ignelater luminosus]|uniref:Caspase-8 n=1 Tax=Ignelater luminosus TaxID=2038154 RepID=A0A8K0CDA9_IGNLU|nr:hypothetical protein ILUMI_24507 [Ignelater luminosus]